MVNGPNKGRAQGIGVETFGMVSDRRPKKDQWKERKAAGKR